jgi:hypothetical protein
VNVIFISPNFPPQFYLFCAALKRQGIRALAIGDVPFHHLRPELQEAVAEYVHLPRMESYDDLYRAVAYLSWRHGRIDRIDSLNEHWLPYEARLREDFNVPGMKPAQVTVHRAKSGMGEVFKNNGIPAPEGARVESPDQVRAFAKRKGYPLVFKPDTGVGASGAFRVNNELQLEAALNKPLADYFVQEFSPGVITTYDGLADAGGRILFSTSFIYSSGVMEVLNEGLDLFYYTRREMPAALDEIGRRTVRAFDIRERFFHLEFFELPDGSLKALEVNLRPPGGFSTDMMNYNCDIDVYSLWAQVLAGIAPADFAFERKYFAAHVARRHHRRYRYPHHEVAARLGPSLVAYQELSPPVSVAMGEQIYLVRFPELEQLKNAFQMIQAQL